MTAQPSILQPDLDFIRRIGRHGGESLKKCYQCATCSVVCTQSPQASPFPRKEMIQAQWGLRQQLFSRPDLWLCHGCNDCTVHCPRGARPGDVMAALRSLFVRHHAVPTRLFDLIHDPERVWIAVAIPIVLLGGILLGLGLAGQLNRHPGSVLYANMMPHWALNTVFTFLVGLDLLVFTRAVYRYWTAMSHSAGIASRTSAILLWSCLRPAGRQILVHERFFSCERSGSSRPVAHLLLLGSFIGLLITTAAAIGSIVLFEYYPLSLTNVFKILGNLSAAALIAGVVLVMRERMSGPERRDVSPGTRFDWVLIMNLGVVGLTGVFCELLRLADVPLGAYPLYFIHLVAVFFLLVYAPYSKLAHLVYRTEAILFSHYSGREHEQPPGDRRTR